MSQNTSASIPENLISALSQLHDELTMVEKTLLELRQKKQEVLQHKLSMGIEHLEIQANKINAIANSLESEILKFKETAVEVNHLYNTIQDSSSLKQFGQDKFKSITLSRQLTNIWEMKSMGFSIPTVIKSESQFIITVKAIDLCKENAPHQSLGQTTKSPVLST